MSAARHVTIRGRVQGVGYRAFTEHAAAKYQLKGWVRNRSDGAVEAVFAGEPDRVRAMIDTCRKGPPGSRIDAIEEREASADEMALCGFSVFVILSTHRG